MKIFIILIIFALSHPLKAVDINTASAAELARELSGIGPVKAQRIVEYREKIGGFVSPEQLTEIKGIGSKTLEKVRGKIEINAVPHTMPPKIEAKDQIKIESMPNRAIDVEADSDLSPKIKKPSRQSHNILLDVLIIMPLFIACLFIFAVAWLKRRRHEKPILRKHLLSTTFVCSACGKTSAFKNVRYEGHFANLYVDGDLPPGWACLPNYLGKPCDYCSAEKPCADKPSTRFTCTQINLLRLLVYTRPSVAAEY
jgi:competence protein ComEA